MPIGIIAATACPVGFKLYLGAVTGTQHVHETIAFSTLHPRNIVSTALHAGLRSSPHTKWSVPVALNAMQLLRALR